MRNTPLLVAVIMVSLGQAGCRGCGDDNTQDAPAKTTATPSSATAPTTPPPPTSPPLKTVDAATTSAARVPTYRGPASKSDDGYQLTMGFADDQSNPLRQPEALQRTHFFVTVLAPNDRPVGELADVDGAQMHGFLLALDMRQLLYAKAPGPIAAGADARELTFRPREGGDHALITAFTTADGNKRTVSSPVVIRGALPAVMGAGVEGLTDVAKIAGGHLKMSPATANVGQSICLSFAAMDDAGRPLANRSTEHAPVLAYDTALGTGRWLSAKKKTEPSCSWTPSQPGTFVVLTVVRRRDKINGRSLPAQPTAFKLVVKAPPKEAASE